MNDIDKSAERELYNANMALQQIQEDERHFIAYCGRCNHGIMSDEQYCMSIDEYFCCRECFEEFYGFKEV